MQKPDEQTLARLNVRIAELCGWREIKQAWPGEPMTGEPDDDWNRDKRSGLLSYEYPMHREPVPLYTSDLNAAHGAVMALCDTPEKQHRYSQRLNGVVYDDSNKSVFHFANAEPWEISIALDRTLSEQPIV